MNITDKEERFIREVVIPKMRHAAPQDQHFAKGETVTDYIERGGVVHIRGVINGSNTNCGSSVGAVSKIRAHQNCIRCFANKRKQVARYLKYPPAA